MLLPTLKLTECDTVAIQQKYAGHTKMATPVILNAPLYDWLGHFGITHTLLNLSISYKELSDAKTRHHKCLLTCSGARPIKVVGSSNSLSLS